MIKEMTMDEALEVIGGEPWDTDDQERMSPTQRAELHGYGGYSNNNPVGYVASKNGFAMYAPPPADPVMCAISVASTGWAIGQAIVTQTPNQGLILGPQQIAKNCKP